VLTVPFGSNHEDVIPLLLDVLPDGNGFLVMLKVYLDRGAKSDSGDGIVSVAATVFKPIRYKQFVRPWNRMLRRWGASAFHATDFYPGGGEFKRNTPHREKLFDQDSKSVPTIIGRFIERILIVAVRPQEFSDALSPRWKEKFGENSHSIIEQLCLIGLGWWAEECCPNERFAYFRESGDEGEGEVDSAVRGMMNDDPVTSRVLRISSYSSVAKGVARGLEASDFVAWHWNKYYMDRLRKGEGDKPRKDFAAFVSTSEKKINFIFLTGADLKYFLSRVPSEFLEEPAKNKGSN
jgi:hypothetical protein